MHIALYKMTSMFFLSFFYLLPQTVEIIKVMVEILHSPQEETSSQLAQAEELAIKCSNLVRALDFILNTFAAREENIHL